MTLPHTLETTEPVGELSASRSPSTRRDDIDWLKGLAIIGVLLIHSDPLEGTWIDRHLLIRAVPAFVVLFGMTSASWWEARAPLATTLAWYRSRLGRLMIPVWATVACWWTLVVLLGQGPPPSLSRILATALGYVPWAQTSWFVTAILQLVVLLPLLRVFLLRVGPLISLTGALAILILSNLHMGDIIDSTAAWVGHHSGEPASLYYFWIFAPRLFYPVLAGMVAIPWIRRRGAWRLAVAAAPVAVVGLLTEERVQNLLWGLAVKAALDVPIVLLLLGAVSVVRFWRPAATLLAWCGTSSWGIYLGQLLIHNAVLMLAMRPHQSPLLWHRWAYFACLLVGSVGLVGLGTALRARAGRLR